MPAAGVMKPGMWDAILVEGLVQLFLAWSNVFNNLAHFEPEIIVAYRYALGSATLFLFVCFSVLAPMIASYFSLPFGPQIVACLLERQQYWPELEWEDLIILAVEAFFCGLLGASLPQNLNVKSLSYLDPKFASVMSNCNPVIVSSITLPIFFRNEIIALRRGKLPGKLKLLGVVLMGWFIWAGALFLDLSYEGPVLLQSRVPKVAPTPPKYNKQILGVVMSICGSVSTALSLILQAKMYKRFPYYFFNMTLVNFMGAIQAIAYALCINHGQGSWNLGFDINLLAVTYLGVVCSGIMTGLTAFSMRRIGLDLVSGFNPVMLIISTGPLIILNGKLRLGSVLSGLVMICGWSAIVWAKIKEQADQSTSPQQEIINSDMELGNTEKVLPAECYIN